MPPSPSPLVRWGCLWIAPIYCLLPSFGCAGVQHSGIFWGAGGFHSSAVLWLRPRL